MKPHIYWWPAKQMWVCENEICKAYGGLVIVAYRNWEGITNCGPIIAY